MKIKLDQFEPFALILFLSLGVGKHQVFGPLQDSSSFIASVCILDKFGVCTKTSNLVLCNIDTHFLAYIIRHDAQILDA
jgi:hypothetical protein